MTNDRLECPLFVGFLVKVKDNDTIEMSRGDVDWTEVYDMNVQ